CAYESDACFFQLLRDVVQLEIPNVRESKHAAGTRADGFGVVDADCSCQGDTAGCKKRFRNAQYCPDIARILQASQNHDSRVCYTDNAVQSKDWRPNQSNKSLRGFRALNAFEYGSFELVDLDVMRNRANIPRATAYEDVHYLQAALYGFFEKFGAFD